MLDILESALRLKGFQVYGLQEVDENLLKLINLARPQVVILDYLLDDGSSCIRSCKEIKDHYPHLPVIATKLQCEHQ